MLAAVLHGSLTLGEFTPGRSDIDLLVIVGGALSDDELAALRDAVAAAGEDAPRRVDLRVVTRATAAVPLDVLGWRPSSRFARRRSIEVETEFVEPDLVPEFSIARAHGRTLVGRPPEAVIGPVTGERVLDAQRVSDLAVRRGGRPLLLRRRPGRWALEREPALGAVEDAWRQRTVDPAVPIGSEGVERILAHVRLELRRNNARWEAAPS